MIKGILTNAFPIQVDFKLLSSPGFSIAGFGQWNAAFI